MVSAVTLLKKCLSVNDSVIDNFKFFEDEYGVTYLHVYLHPLKSHSNRCPVCGKRCPIYDRSLVYHKWRGLDLGGIIVELYSHAQRICCKEHGIKTAPSTGSSGSRFETSGLKIIKSFVFKIVASPYLIHSEKKKFHKDSDFKEGKRRNMRTYYTLSIKNILYSF